MDEISIDRLVLHVPGLTAKQSEELAKKVGAGLAAKPAKTGSFDRLTVELNDQFLTQDISQLASLIVDSVLQQIG